MKKQNEKKKVVKKKPKERNKEEKVTLKNLIKIATKNPNMKVGDLFHIKVDKFLKLLEEIEKNEKRRKKL